MTSPFLFSLLCLGHIRLLNEFLFYLIIDINLRSLFLSSASPFGSTVIEALERSRMERYSNKE